MGALDGIKVIDMSAVLMGPFAARILGDMGADVIKIEPPGGDTVRGIGPMHGAGMGPMYLHANRSKRSAVLNLKSAQGKEALLRLVKSADVLLYNARPQAMARLELGYEVCRAVNPALIYVGAFGFGQDGPYAARPAFDDLIQGLSAMPSLIAQVGDGVPRYVPMAIVDRYVGVTVVNAVLGALVHRLRTGVGQAVEVPMFETMAECVLSDHLAGQTFEPPLGPAGYTRSLAPERHPYRTRDGYVCAMLYSDKHWRAFLTLVGSDLMDTDPDFATLTSRTVHARKIHSLLEEFLQSRTTDEWLAAFEQADIPATRLNTLDSLVLDPHLQATGFFESHEHPSEGRLRMTRPVARWSETPLAITRHPPRLGEHTREVLAEAGYSSDQIESMIASGAACAAVNQA